MKNEIYFVENSGGCLDLKPKVVNISKIYFNKHNDTYVTSDGDELAFFHGDKIPHVKQNSKDYFLKLTDAIEYIFEQSKLSHNQKKQIPEDLSSKLKEFAKQKAAQVEDIDIQELESLVIAGANWMLENKK